MKTPPWRGRAGKAAVALSLIVLNATAVHADGPTAKDVSEIADQLKAVLPRGATIVRSVPDEIPDDWSSFDKTGILVEGTCAGQAFKTWFLPRDWIGIRRSRPDRSLSVSWDTVLLGEKYKAITQSEDVAIQNAVANLGMRTPSLVNGAWLEAETIFKGRFDEADRTAHKLIDRFCKTDADRDEAAHSLVVSEVPARSVFLEGALKGSRRATSISALQFFPGKDTTQVLLNVLTDPASPRDCQKRAAAALRSVAEPDSGPALADALAHLTQVEVATAVADALARIHHREGAARILERMNVEPNPYYKNDFARSLATLRCQEAIPAIEKLCKTKSFTAEWASGNTHSWDREPEEWRSCA